MTTHAHPIAVRALKLRHEGAEADIAIRIFAPEPDGTSWSCRYEIDWHEGRQAMTAGGVDSVQALVTALQMIGADIYSSSYHKSGALRFDVAGNGYGFPVAPTLKDLLEGDDIRFFG